MRLYVDCVKRTPLEPRGGSGAVIAMGGVGSETPKAADTPLVITAVALDVPLHVSASRRVAMTEKARRDGQDDLKTRKECSNVDGCKVMGPSPPRRRVHDMLSSSLHPTQLAPHVTARQVGSTSQKACAAASETPGSGGFRAAYVVTDPAPKDVQEPPGQSPQTVLTYDELLRTLGIVTTASPPPPPTLTPEARDCTSEPLNERLRSSVSPSCERRATGRGVKDVVLVAPTPTATDVANRDPIERVSDPLGAVTLSVGGDARSRREGGDAKSAARGSETRCSIAAPTVSQSSVAMVHVPPATVVGRSAATVSAFTVHVHEPLPGRTPDASVTGRVPALDTEKRKVAPLLSMPGRGAQVIAKARPGHRRASPTQGVVKRKAGASLKAGDVDALRAPLHPTLTVHCAPSVSPSVKRAGGSAQAYPPVFPVTPGGDKDKTVAPRRRSVRVTEHGEKKEDHDTATGASLNEDAPSPPPALTAAGVNDVTMMGAESSYTAGDEGCCSERVRVLYDSEAPMAATHEARVGNADPNANVPAATSLALSDAIVTADVRLEPARRAVRERDVVVARTFEMTKRNVRGELGDQATGMALAPPPGERMVTTSGG